MPCNLKLHYKKYATKEQTKDAGATDVATDIDAAADDDDDIEKIFSSSKFTHSS